MTKMYMRGGVYYGAAEDMIDRIEELEAKLEKAEQRGYANAMEAERKMHDDCIGELKTKLAKAVGLLEAWVNVAVFCTIEDGVCCCGLDITSHGNPLDHGHVPVDHGAYVARGLVEKTDSTLAELTGGKDE